MTGAAEQCGGDSLAGRAVETAEAMAAAVDDVIQPENDIPDELLGAPARLARWMGPVFAALALLTVPWTVYLGFNLPTRATAEHYDVAWAGFDVGLVVVLAWTAWCAMRRSPNLAIAASMNAVMLLVDAWFDVVTAPSGTELALALAMALLVEMPLSVVCVWLARNGQRIAERRVTLRLRGAGRRSSP